MKHSSDRILTTHVGSLPRPAPLLDMLEAENTGGDVDAVKLQSETARAVADIVARQSETGIDVVSDGEMSKISYTFYVRHRLAGIGEGDPARGRDQPEMVGQDLIDHPDFAERQAGSRGGGWRNHFVQPLCVGPIAYRDRAPLDRDLANFAAAVDAMKPAGAFMNAASPGVLTKFVPNTFYPDEDAYVEALSGAMKVEYEAIHAAGFLLQIDCPDLGSARHNQYKHLSDAEFLRIAERNVAAVNAATANIPPEDMRLHICWGNYEGPHNHDVPLATVFDVCMKARPRGFLFEGANPRHEHEWEDLANARIPDDVVLIPGVIDSTSNFIEHPRLIAQRICRYADIVGRERVIAGADCGFATFAGRDPQVVDSVVWAKFEALAEGARIASERLWN
jgi:5-methyltetrahydropteroyltriglutamate--homocysteine methyltransferase